MRDERLSPAQSAPISGLISFSAADAPDVHLALLSRGFRNPPDHDDFETQTQAFFLALRQDPPCEHLARIAFRLAAFEWVDRSAATIPVGRVTIDDLLQVLYGFQRAFRRWPWEEKSRTRGRDAVPRKWHIDNEYHFQDALWVILAPLFPDLKEEFSPSTGQLQPRIDLAIPSLATAIEAKFMYAKTTPQQMIEQIAADLSLYLKPGSGYHHLVPIIWDDAARTEEHPRMIRGMRDLSDVHDAIVISRPAKMRQSSAPTS